MSFPGLLSFTVLLYGLAITAVVLFYVYYTTPDDCTEHKVFISLNLIFCIIISIVSILPKIQVQCAPVLCHLCEHMKMHILFIFGTPSLYLACFFSEKHLKNETS